MAANLDNSDLIDSLADQISGNLERKRAAKEAIPDVYKSGMRGSEKPPALRNADTKDARAKGLGKGIDPEKAKKAQGNRSASGEKKEVKFVANKGGAKARIKALEAQVAELLKAAKKPAIKI